MTTKFNAMNKIKKVAKANLIADFITRRRRKPSASAGYRDGIPTGLSEWVTQSLLTTLYKLNVFGAEVQP